MFLHTFMLIRALGLMFFSPVKHYGHLVLGRERAGRLATCLFCMRNFVTVTLIFSSWCHELAAACGIHRFFSFNFWCSKIKIHTIDFSYIVNKLKIFQNFFIQTI